MPLRVVALKSTEINETVFACDSIEPPEARSGAFTEWLISKALVLDEPSYPSAFASPDEVGSLDDHEIRELAGAVDWALSRIGPTYARSDTAAWKDVLRRGARNNLAEAYSLGGCVDISMGPTSRYTIARPDRYFGVPLVELTDGHWMAYRAAREVWEEDSK